MAFASRQPCKEVKPAERKSTHYSILGSRKSGQNPIAEWASGANVTEMFLDYAPERTTKVLTRQSCGRGGWVREYPSGSRFRGGGRWEEVRVGSGVLKVLGAFWDKLEGTPSAHAASGWHLSDREIASIHRPDSPGHPGRFIARQINRRTCNILRPAEPADGMRGGSFPTNRCWI